MMRTCSIHRPTTPSWVFSRPPTRRRAALASGAFGVGPTIPDGKGGALSGSNAPAAASLYRESGRESDRDSFVQLRSRARERLRQLVVVTGSAAVAWLDSEGNRFGELAPPLRQHRYLKRCAVLVERDLWIVASCRGDFVDRALDNLEDRFAILRVVDRVARVREFVDCRRRHGLTH